MSSDQQIVVNSFGRYTSSGVDQLNFANEWPKSYAPDLVLGNKLILSWPTWQSTKEITFEYGANQIKVVIPALIQSQMFWYFGPKIKW